MRIAGYVLLVVLSTGVVIASGVVAATYGSKDDGWGILLASFGALALIVGPIVLYSVLAFWDVRRSSSATARYRRYRGFAIAATVAGAVSFAMWGAIVAAPLWCTVLFIAIGGALLGGVLVAGPHLQRDLSRRPPPASRPWERATRAELRRVGRASLISGSVALVIATAVVASLLLGFNAASQWLSALPVVIGVAVFAAVAPVFVANFRLTKWIRDTLDGDMGLARKFARVVVKNKPEDLTEDERKMAARWASMVWLLLAGQLVRQLPILLVVLVFPVLRFLSGEQDFPQNLFLIVMIVAFLFLIVYAIPVTIRSIIRCRRYAAQHADLIAATD